MILIRKFIPASFLFVAFLLIISTIKTLAQDSQWKGPLPSIANELSSIAEKFNVLGHLFTGDLIQYLLL